MKLACCLLLFGFCSIGFLTGSCLDVGADQRAYWLSFLRSHLTVYWGGSSENTLNFNLKNRSSKENKYGLFRSALSSCEERSSHTGTYCMLESQCYSIYCLNWCRVACIANTNTVRVARRKFKVQYLCILGILSRSEYPRLQHKQPQIVNTQKGMSMLEVCLLS